MSRSRCTTKERPFLRGTASGSSTRSAAPRPRAGRDSGSVCTSPARSSALMAASFRWTRPPSRARPFARYCRGFVSPALQPTQGLRLSLRDAGQASLTGALPLQDLAPARDLARHQLLQRLGRAARLVGKVCAQIQQPLAGRLVFDAFPSAPFSLATTSAGVPLGANRAFHALTWNSGRPPSLVVGTSGSAGERFSVAIPYALMLPAWIWGVRVTIWSHM